jgi:hypothetical protein
MSVLKAHWALVVAAILGFAVWLGSLLGLLLSEWYLECSVDGQQVGGIDCIQVFPDGVQTDDRVGRWFGFVPLVVAFGLSTVLLIVLGAWLDKRSRAASCRDRLYSARR